MKLENIRKETGTDAVLITDPFNMRYLSGFRGGEGMLCLSKNRRVLITDSRYTEAAQKESDFQVIEECMEEDGAEIVGYEDCSLRCREFEDLRKALPAVKEWVPLGGSIDRLRRIKTPEEQELLQKAEAIGDAAFAELLKVLRPGMTELEAAAELEYQMKKHGASGFSFDTIMASGANSSMPHAVETGDFVTMDFGCLYEGYCSDMTRTVVLGRASEKQREIYDTVLRAQKAALDVIRAGMTGSEVDRAARRIIEEAGYGQCFGHGLGHSVGLFIHEEPRLSPADDTVLEAGMSETVEPGIYLPGFGGVRIEDLVIVTEDGCRNLTRSPRELIEL